MSGISKDEVRRIARLAYLELPRVHDDRGAFTEPSDPLLSDADLERFAREIGAILDYVAELSELDLEGVEKTSHGVPLPPLFREDEATSRLETEKALREAPARSGDSFSVPKVIE